ncbi:MAG: hypothetical protein ABIP75_06005 [Pyrinomonadaceae bacterium]
MAHYFLSNLEMNTVGILVGAGICFFFGTACLVWPGDTRKYLIDKYLVKGESKLSDPISWGNKLPGVWFFRLVGLILVALSFGVVLLLVSD